MVVEPLLNDKTRESGISEESPLHSFARVPSARGPHKPVAVATKYLHAPAIYPTIRFYDEFPWEFIHECPPIGGVNERTPIHLEAGIAGDNSQLTWYRQPQSGAIA